MSLASLSACTSINSKVFSLTKPTLQSYSNKTQDAIAREAESGGCPVMSSILPDYSVMRDQTRAIP